MRLSKVENFHRQLTNILTEEINGEISRVKAQISDISNGINELEAQLKLYDVPSGISKGLLNKYAELSSEINRLEKQRENGKMEIELKNVKKEYEKQLFDLKSKELLEVQSCICEELRRLNDFVCNGMKESPMLQLSERSYTFMTPDDTGTGTNYKGLILYDLSILNLTSLPILIHDSNLLVNIGDEPQEKIINLYSMQNKQIFVAFAKNDIKSQQTSEILNAAKVIELSKGGNELFGRSWSDVQREVSDERA